MIKNLVVRYSPILTFYAVAVALLAAFQVMGREVGLSYLAIPILLFITGVVTALFALFGFRKTWLIRHLFLLPEWSVVADLLAVMIVFFLTIIPVMTGRLRLFPSLPGDLVASTAIFFGGYAARRSFMLIKLRFLLARPGRKFSNRPGSDLTHDVSAFISRLSILALVLVLIWYSRLPAWMASSSFLFGWALQSLFVTTRKERESLGRVNMQLAPEGSLNALEQTKRPTQAFLKAKEAILDGKASTLRSLLSDEVTPGEELLLKVMFLAARRSYKSIISLLTSDEVKQEVRISGRLTYFLELSYYHLGLYDDVIRIAREYLASGQTSNPFVYLYPGLAEGMKGNMQQALSYEEIAEKLSKEKNRKFGDLVCPMALTFQGLLRARTVAYGDFSSNQLSIADTQVKEAIRIVDKQAESGYLKKVEGRALRDMCEDVLGYIWYKQGLAELSVGMFEKIIGRSPAYPWPYFHLALQYFRWSQKTGRDEYLRSATAIFERICREDDYSIPLQEQARKMLARIRCSVPAETIQAADLD